MKGFFRFVRRRVEPPVGAAAYVVLFPFQLPPQSTFGTGIPVQRQMNPLFNAQTLDIEPAVPTVGYGQQVGQFDMTPLVAGGGRGL